MFKLLSNNDKKDLIWNVLKVITTELLIENNFIYNLNFRDCIGRNNKITILFQEWINLKEREPISNKTHFDMNLFILARN